MTTDIYRRKSRYATMAVGEVKLPGLIRGHFRERVASSFHSHTRPVLERARDRVALGPVTAHDERKRTESGSGASARREHPIDSVWGVGARVQHKCWVVAIMNESAVAVLSVMLKVELNNHYQEIENIGEILSHMKSKAMASPQMAEQVELQNILPIDKDYLTCIGCLTAPCYKENVVWIVLALPVMVSKQAVARMKELRYEGEKSYKMAVNVRKIDSFWDLIVFSPAQVRYNNCSENLSNLMFQEYGKSFDGEFERLKIVSDTVNAAYYKGVMFLLSR